MSMRRLLALVAGVPLLAVLLFVAWGYWAATRDPVVVRYDIALADWPAGTPPMRVVQMSDIHFGWPDMPEKRVARLVAQANALTPDLIVLSGDFSGGKFWDRDIGTMDVAVRPLRKLRARYGVVAVRGNHDSAYWTPIVFGRTSIAMLQNRWVRAGPVVVAGVDDFGGPANPTLSPTIAAQGVPAGVPLIVVGHQPNFFQYLPRGADLMLAGHTHGGQVVLPFYGTRSMNDPYLDAHRRGHFVEHGQQMIVSSGIGTSVLPLRIGVPPEIVVITLGPVTR